MLMMQKRGKSYVILGKPLASRSRTIRSAMELLQKSQLIPLKLATKVVSCDKVTKKIRLFTIRKMDQEVLIEEIFLLVCLLFKIHRQFRLYSIASTYFDIQSVLLLS